jgi:transcription initiation factor TFIIIB Brf1 subunit/transcription initiation factor TFIIB
VFECGLKSKELLDRNPDWNSFNDGKNTNSRCGCPTNFFLPQSSLGTKVPMNFSYSKIARLQKWHQMPYKERSLNDVLQYITKVCKEHNVNGSIIDNARILFKQINDTKHLEGINEGKNIITRGRNRKSLISACVFVGSCLQGQPILPKVIAEIFSLEEKEVTRGCRNIREILKNNIIMRNLKPNQTQTHAEIKLFLFLPLVIIFFPSFIPSKCFVSFICLNKILALSIIEPLTLCSLHTFVIYCNTSFKLLSLYGI